jgi:hypothetical protein
LPDASTTSFETRIENRGGSGSVVALDLLRTSPGSASAASRTDWPQPGARLLHGTCVRTGFSHQPADRLSVTGTIDAHSDDAGAGTVDLLSFGSLDITGTIDATGGGFLEGGSGGIV